MEKRNMILHLTNDYSGSTVYMNLVNELDKNGNVQCVYNPIRNKNKINKNKINFIQSESRIIYDFILNNSDRLLYLKKISKIVKEIERKVDLSKVQLIHAHTWYSDGGVAYLLSKKYNIPYILAIRSSDIVFFYKYLVFFRKFGRDILLHSSRVIHISKAYHNTFMKLTGIKKIIPTIEDKIEIIPNGIDNYWLDNLIKKRDNINNPLKIIYVGSFVKRKNLSVLQEAIIMLNDEMDVRVQLLIVGEKGRDTKKVISNCENYPQYFKLYGSIKNKAKLKDIYSQADIFAMPSINETFGLVYIEALSQGLPIVYTENDGIDGFYTNEIGEKVSKPLNSRIIALAIMKLVKNYQQYKINNKEILNNHKWANIAARYTELYKTII